MIHPKDFKRAVRDSKRIWPNTSDDDWTYYAAYCLIRNDKAIQTPLKPDLSKCVIYKIDPTEMKKIDPNYNYSETELVYTISMDGLIQKIDLLHYK